jgi:DNA-binding transcriptional MerR regulator
MSIGEVLARLREDFPDITISKLRFLEAEGLVEPQRTAAGYRKYSAADVDRLGFVLAAQRDRFLPLRVIRDRLAAIDAGEVDPSEPIDGGFADDAVGGTEPPAELPADLRLRREELLERTGLSDTDLRELENVGVIAARSPGWYDGDALIIATVAAGFAAHGIGARHLRAFRTAADREVGLYTALVAPMAKSASPTARARAVETVRELGALSQQLHAALVRMGLRDVLGQ